MSNFTDRDYLNDIQTTKSYDQNDSSLCNRLQAYAVQVWELQQTLAARDKQITNQNNMMQLLQKNLKVQQQANIESERYLKEARGRCAELVADNFTLRENIEQLRLNQQPLKVRNQNLSVKMIEIESKYQKSDKEREQLMGVM